MIKNVLTTVGISLLITACAMDQKKVEEELQQPAPVNCASAEGDLRLLQHEKADVAERMAEGVTSIAPAGLVVGIITGTEPVKINVATGEYNDMIDRRIAQIKRTCGL